MDSWVQYDHPEGFDVKPLSLSAHLLFLSMRLSVQNGRLSYMLLRMIS